MVERKGRGIFWIIRKKTKSLTSRILKTITKTKNLTSRILTTYIKTKDLTSRILKTFSVSKTLTSYIIIYNTNLSEKSITGEIDKKIQVEGNIDRVESINVGETN